MKVVMNNNGRTSLKSSFSYLPRQYLQTDQVIFMWKVAVLMQMTFVYQQCHVSHFLFIILQRKVVHRLPHIFTTFAWMYQMSDGLQLIRNKHDAIKFDLLIEIGFRSSICFNLFCPSPNDEIKVLWYRFLAISTSPRFMF